MKHHLSAYFCGLLFGLGLAISDMVNPERVIGFLNVTGQWDPALIFVMGSALLVNMIGYQLIFRRGKPLLAEKFHLPVSTHIDAPLLTGSILFGMGWGLSGYCPGPAITSIAFGATEPLIFMAAMITGALLYQRFEPNLTEALRPTEARRPSPVARRPQPSYTDDVGDY